MPFQKNMCNFEFRKNEKLKNRKVEKGQGCSFNFEESKRRKVVVVWIPKSRKVYFLTSWNLLDAFQKEHVQLWISKVEKSKNRKVEKEKGCSFNFEKSKSILFDCLKFAGCLSKSVKKNMRNFEFRKVDKSKNRNVEKGKGCSFNFETSKRRKVVVLIYSRKVYFLTFWNLLDVFQKEHAQLWTQ